MLEELQALTREAAVPLDLLRYGPHSSGCWFVHAWRGKTGFDGLTVSLVALLRARSSEDRAKPRAGDMATYLLRDPDLAGGHFPVLWREFSDASPARASLPLWNR